jgi:hypothetical protein
MRDLNALMALNAQPLENFKKSDFLFKTTTLTDFKGGMRISSKCALSVLSVQRVSP